MTYFGGLLFVPPSSCSTYLSFQPRLINTATHERSYRQSYFPPSLLSLIHSCHVQQWSSYSFHTPSANGYCPIRDVLLWCVQPYFQPLRRRGVTEKAYNTTRGILGSLCVRNFLRIVCYPHRTSDSPFPNSHVNMIGVDARPV
jgi:hypothetical protein